MFVDCLVDLHKHNVKVVLVRDTLTLDGEAACKGYWDDDNWREPELYCLVLDDENWIQTFVHEYGHFCQFRERIPLWKRHRRYTQEDDDNVFGNIPMHKKRLDTYIRDVRNLELDCERRAVKIFNQYNVPQDEIDLYIKHANIYIHFYTYAKWYREWPKDVKDSPVRQPRCLQVSPCKFQDDYDTIPDELLDVFIDLYPPKYEVK